MRLRTYPSNKLPDSIEEGILDDKYEFKHSKFSY